MHSMIEKIRAATTTNVICWVNIRVGPLMNAHGRKAMIVVRTPNTTGLSTSCVPTMAASRPSRRPLSISR